MEVGLTGSEWLGCPVDAPDIHAYLCLLLSKRGKYLQDELLVVCEVEISHLLTLASIVVTCEGHVTTAMLAVPVPTRS